MFKLTVKILAVLILVLHPAVFASVEDDFAQANKLYEQRNYDSAIVFYKSILNNNTQSSELYFNLGNAYFKNGDLGRAILNYHRAKRLNPGDEDVINNLEFARNFTRIQMEGIALNPVSTFTESIIDPYKLEFLAWLSSFLFIVLIGILIFRYGLGYGGAVIRVSITTVLVLLVLSFSLTTYKYRTDYLTRRAVIISEECSIHTGPSEQSEVEFTGAPGLVLEILAESTDYLNVLLENKRRGWIKKDFVAEI